MIRSNPLTRMTKVGVPISHSPAQPRSYMPAVDIHTSKRRRLNDLLAPDDEWQPWPDKTVSTDASCIQISPQTHFSALDVCTRHPHAPPTFRFFATPA